MSQSLTIIFVFSMCFAFTLGVTFQYDRYYGYNDYTVLLKSLSEKYPNKTHLYSIGKSVSGKELWVLALSDSQADKHTLLRPEVRYVGNIHGNEVPPKELLLYLSEYLLENQIQNEDIDRLLKTTRIHLLFSLNPDGLAESKIGGCTDVIGRYNKNGYDLNRNFPDLFECSDDTIQPETQSVIDWFEKNNFILSGSFHGGALVANYPFDNQRISNTYGANPTKDDDVFKAMSETYASTHSTMKNSTCYGEIFKNGITNGAEWYPIKGGMQDFSYWKYGCSEVTFEITCCKYPPPSHLNQIWQDNKFALIEYMKYAHKGVRGIISYENGQPAKYITVRIDEREPYFKTNDLGEFYRILLPGKYNLVLMYNCDEFKRMEIEIPSSTGLLELNITLESKYLLSSIKYSMDKYPVFCTKAFQPVTCNALNITKNENINLNYSNKIISFSIVFYFLFLFVFIFVNDLV